MTCLSLLYLPQEATLAPFTPLPRSPLGHPDCACTLPPSLAPGLREMCFVQVRSWCQAFSSGITTDLSDVFSLFPSHFCVLFCFLKVYLFI